MRIRKVTLIEPKPPGYHVYNRVILPRLGLPTLGALLKRRGCDVTIYCQDLGGVDYDDMRRSDLVGISTTTSTAPEAYRLADKARSAGVPVVLGGSHTTFLPEEALRHADYCVRGEGEETLIELVDALESGAEPVGINGLSYRRGEEIVHNPARGLIRDLDSLPFPDLSMIRQNERMTIKPISTSRGCPFDCNFCSVTRMFGRGYRFRSVDNVMDELKQLNAQKVFFYDDNFTVNRAHTKELLESMLSSGVTPLWTAQVRADVAKDRELLNLMRKSNCYFVYIGFESIDPATLQEYNKRQNVEQIVEAIRVIREHGIMIHGMFVLGADNDTTRTIRDTVKFALKHRIDTVQLMSLTPLPGTPYFKKMEDEDRLLTRDWSLYDGHHVVYRPKNMSAYEMQKEMVLAIKKFYSPYQCIKMLIRPDFLTFLANLLVGRWRQAKAHARMRVYGWFYRAYGHLLVKRFEAANRDFADKIKSIAEGARELAKPKLSDAKRLD
ncbi:MAG: radical SAM protein [Armatimonadetes bacterium]|nr:radical SAM protein [Armatimonadota bacterium]